MARKANDKVNRIENAIAEGCEQIYFNGFANAIGIGDIIITLERNGKPVAVLNTSYTVAKTLAIKLNELIQTLENKTGSTIMVTDKIASSLNLKEKGNDKPKQV